MFSISVETRAGVTRHHLDSAIDALVRMDDEHVLALIEAIYRAYLNAIHVFAFDATFDNDVRHYTLSEPWLTSACAEAKQYAPHPRRAKACSSYRAPARP